MSAGAELSGASQPVVALLAAQSERYETPCGGGTMAWRRWGKGPPLLLLHGAHGSWMHWIGNIRHLSQTRTIWVPDIPGFGDSALPSPEPSIDALVAALDAGLTALPIEKPLDVAAFSFGGTVAAHLAVLAPERVRRIVLIDCGGLGTPMAPVATRPVRSDGSAIAAHRHNLHAMMIHDPSRIDDLALHVQALHVPLARLDVRKMVLPDRLIRALERSTVPVDAIWGEHDQPHPDPLLQIAALRQVRPAARLRVVPGAGHWSIYENPAVTHTHLDELLRP